MLFSGCCAEHTLSAQILADRSSVDIFSEPDEMRAQIASIDTYSGHADKHEMRRCIETLTGDNKMICVIRGEEAQWKSFNALPSPMF